MYAKLSFFSFCLAFALLVLAMIATFVSGYSVFASTLETLRTVTGIVLLVLGPVSLVTGIISLFQKNTNKILPTISVSVTSFATFMALFILAGEGWKPVYVENGTFTNYGIFDIPVKDTSNNPLYELRFLRHNTDSIPALKGLRFGFNYVITGEPDDHVVTVRKITRYPKPGLKISNRTVLADTIYFSVTLNELRYSGFRFDYDYELIPGKWEFEMAYDGKTLFSKAFNVFSQGPGVSILPSRSAFSHALPPNRSLKPTCNRERGFLGNRGRNSNNNQESSLVQNRPSSGDQNIARGLAPNL